MYRTGGTKIDPGTAPIETFTGYSSSGNAENSASHDRFRTVGTLQQQALP
jgi:hypothetical protein